MAEIVVRVRGRNASIEVSDEEAQKILNDLLFLSQSPQPVATISNTAKPADIDNESKRITVSGSDYLPIPSREEVVSFIKSQPNYKHSVESIAEHFAHHEVSSTDGEAAEAWLNSIRGYGNRIRDEIKDQEKGVWKLERRGRKKTFWFVKPEDNASIQSYTMQSGAMP